MSDKRSARPLRGRRALLNYNPETELPQLRALLSDILTHPPKSDEDWRRILRRHPKPEGGFYGKPALIAGARRLVELGELNALELHTILSRHLRLKPSRTQSGVSTVTVLTKPFPCPGQCIFCPNDVRMPKSYLADEPGAQRAAHNQFDPFAQTWNRLLALHNIGHPVEKVELIVLGGTWSSYTKAYQRYFVMRMFDACNRFGKALELHLTLGEPLKPADSINLHPSLALSGNEIEDQLSLEQSQNAYNRVVNQTLRSAHDGSLEGDQERASWDDVECVQCENVDAYCRVVGLTVETRPDEITPDEVERLRRLGATKVQLGVQSLNDEVLRLNRRGHSVTQAREASLRLRSAGLKLHYHWMANLYGSDPILDQIDYEQLFSDPAMCPDELKLYPCSLVPKTPLMSLYQSGEWRPYTRNELLKLLTGVMPKTPPYCRLTRVIRDIPSTDIHVGNQETNFREVAEQELRDQGIELAEIRSREIRGTPISSEPPLLKRIRYRTTLTEEEFISFEDALSGKLLGFCRLSLPLRDSSGNHLTAEYLSIALKEELLGAAIIRELHVYGQSLRIGGAHGHAAQHRGLGAQLVEQAAEIADQEGYSTLAVISSIGTRSYYKRLGFVLKSLYQHRSLT